jgi:hypothetical protein
MTVGRFNPRCITVAGEPYDHHFIDAFALSWTTFSTVVRVQVHLSSSLAKV